LQVEQLLDSGVNVNAQDAYGETALHLACMEGQYTVVRMLVVEQQARMDMRNWEGWVPMIWAIVRGHVEIVKFLAERVCSHCMLAHVLVNSVLMIMCFAPTFTEGM
jgi:ankyrin repeat protein